MERRVLLAISLSFLVLFLYQSLVPPPVEPPVAQRHAGHWPGRRHPGAAPPGRPRRPRAPPPPPAVAAVQADDREREFVVDHPARRGGVHQPRRPAARIGGCGTIAPPLGRRRGPGARHRRHQRCRSRSSPPDAALTARMNDVLFAVENAAPERIDATSTPAVLSSSTKAPMASAVRKQFAFDPSGYVVTFDAGGRRWAARRSTRASIWGPGLGDEIARTAGSGGFFSGTYVYPAEGFVSPRRRRHAVRRRRGVHGRSRSRAPSASSASTITTSWRPWSTPRAVSGSISRTCRWPIRRSPTCRPPARVVQRRLRRAAGVVCAFFVGPKQFEALRQVDPEFTQGDQLRDVRDPGGAAARRVAVGQRLRRQLRLGDHHPHDPDQPGDVAAAAQERGVDAAGCRSCSRS